MGCARDVIAILATATGGRYALCSSDDRSYNCHFIGLCGFSSTSFLSDYVVLAGCHFYRIMGQDVFLGGVRTVDVHHNYIFHIARCLYNVTVAG